jgi:hypothetical protein
MGPMAPEPTTAKLCTVCGTDCAGRPRIRDQQGRYICKECFDRAKQTRQTQKNPPSVSPLPTQADTVSAPADGDNSFLLNLGSKESTGIQGTKPCPECGRAMSSNAVLCIGCGYNTSTGRRIPVRVIKTKEKAPKAEGAGSSSLNVMENGPLIGGIVLVVWAGAAAAMFLSPEFGFVVLLLAALLSLCVNISVLVCAFRDSIVWGLVVFFVPFVSLLWVYAINEDTRLKWAFTGNLLGIVAFYAMLIGGMISLKGF